MAVQQENDDYYLSCPKCQDDGSDGICVDGVWFFDTKNPDDVTPIAGLYCCTKCIVWFRKNSRNWFQDDVKRSWFRYTKSDVCKWQREAWDSSQERSAEFVRHFLRKESDKKVQKATRKKKEICKKTLNDQKKAAATGTPRKRKRPIDLVTVDSVSVVTSAESFTIERYDPTTTFTSFQQTTKMIKAFLKMCHDTNSGTPNHISDSVYEILKMQVNVIETLVGTLQHHIK